MVQTTSAKSEITFLINNHAIIYLPYTHGSGSYHTLTNYTQTYSSIVLALTFIQRNYHCTILVLRYCFIFELHAPYLSQPFHHTLATIFYHFLLFHLSQSPSHSSVVFSHSKEPNAPSVVGRFLSGVLFSVLRHLGTFA